MTGPDHIEGLAIVSADGMIADSNGIQPDALKLEPDQRFFFGELAKADVLAHGRHSGEGGPSAPHKLRIILTRSVAGVGRDPSSDKTVLWNPAGAPLEAAWEALDPPGGRLVVIGGTAAFGLFLPRYDTFHLSRAAKAHLPGGRPVFPGIPPRTPEDLLAEGGLKPGATRLLDASLGLSLTTWQR